MVIIIQVTTKIIPFTATYGHYGLRDPRGEITRKS
jgi:hypothetical protein